MGVSVVQCSSYSDVESTIRRSISLIGGIRKFIKPNQKVLLKPNICDPLPPEKAATTHPEFIRAVINIIREVTPNVAVAEQSASKDPGTTARSLRISGVYDVLKEMRVKFINMQEYGFYAKELNDYLVLEKTDFSRALLEFDVVVNLPKFKTHGLSYVTGAVKNCFGFLHPDERKYVHGHFSEISEFNKALVDIYNAVKPVLHIMDGVIAMEGDEGPSYGDPKLLGYVGAAQDGFELDYVFSKITGHDAKKIPFLAGQRMPAVIGDTYKVCTDFRRHSHYSVTLLQPHITEKCKRCGECYRNCPASAVVDENGRYSIDNDKCIKCYCCQEVCVHGAINLTNPDQAADLLRLGTNCNQKCIFCTAITDNDFNLSTDEAKAQIKFIKDNGNGKIAFTGGEPLARQDILELVSYASGLGLHVEMQTNGIALNEKLIVDLKKNGLKFFCFSLHSHNHEIYGKITGTKTLQKAIAALDLIKKHNMEIKISHVINRLNYKNLPDFVRFVHDRYNVPLYLAMIRPNLFLKNDQTIVPRLSEIELYLIRALEFCRENSIECDVEGIPLCYMQGFEKLNCEISRSNFKPKLHIEGAQIITDTHNRHLNEHKQDSDACLVCCHNEYCPKLWKEYAEIHGTDELYPVFGCDLTW